MLVHRLRRWPNIKAALVKRAVFAGITYGTRNGIRRFVAAFTNLWMLGDVSARGYGGMDHWHILLGSGRGGSLNTHQASLWPAHASHFAA